MAYRAIKAMRHDRLGVIPKGGNVRVDEQEGERLRRLGLVELYETKVVRPRPAENPPPADGTPSSASPAAQVSRQTTAKKSARGGKKKGKRAAKSSS